MAALDHVVHYLEIVTTDPEGTKAFHEGAFGWRFERVPVLGNALVATLPDGSRCGIRAPMHEQEKPLVRVYLRVADVESAAKRAEALGATIALEPTELPGHGTISIYFIGGVEQGIWQPA